MRIVLVLGVLAMPNAVAAQRSVAQSDAPRRLRPAEAVLTREFTQITGLREFAGNRTLIVDLFERLVLVADWRSLRVEQIGRAGDGPGEYRGPRWATALAADSTMVRDATTRRRLIYDGARYVATITPDKSAWGLLAGEVSADRRGNVLGTWAFHFAPKSLRFNSPGSADSLMVLLLDRASGRVDTVARMRGGYRGETEKRKRVNGRDIDYTLMNPYAATDQALLFADGWIAVARGEPYQVEWRSPTNTVIRGAPLPFERVQVSEPEKRFAIAQRWGWLLKNDVWGPDDFADWPVVVPPFPNEALLAAPDGNLVILRTPSVSLPAPHYDIVDRRGGLAGTLVLNPDERIVGFGAQSVYVTVTDADGVQRLRRHPWP